MTPLIRFNCVGDSTTLGLLATAALRRYSSGSSTTPRIGFNLEPFYSACNAAGIVVSATAAQLTWAIGFIEGDGSLTTHGARRIELSVVQKELAVLKLLQSVLLGVGNIVSVPGGYYRWVVSDVPSLTLLLALFNGNLVLPRRVAQLQVWCTIYKVALLPFHVLPTLGDGWLSGFTDAEGCFNVSLHRLGLTFRFMLDQKGALSALCHIASLFGAPSTSVSPRLAVVDMYRLTLGATRYPAVVAYFALFPLRSKKAASLARWMELRGMATRGEVPKDVQQRRALCASVNPK